METGRHLGQLTSQPGFLLQVPGQWEALSNRMKWTAPEKCHQSLSSGLCMYPHMCVHTERTGLCESGVNTVGFLKGGAKGVRKCLWRRQCHSGDLKIDNYMGMHRQRLHAGEGSLCKGWGPWQTCDLCFFPSSSVSMSAASWLGPFLNFTRAPFPGCIPTLLGPIA